MFKDPGAAALFPFGAVTLLSRPRQQSCQEIYLEKNLRVCCVRDLIYPLPFTFVNAPFFFANHISKLLFLS